MANNKKIYESDLIDAFREGRKEILKPLKLVDLETETSLVIGNAQRQVDARMVGVLPREPDRYTFVVEVKSSNTPRTVRDAMNQVKMFAQPGENPMILVPYLSEESLDELEQKKVSGIDLCGNGVVTVPGRLLIRRSGRPNQYPVSRPLQNPFQGKSAMIARAFFTEQVFSSVGDVRKAVQKGGCDISLSQVSKTVRALKEDLVVGGQKRSLHLMDPDKLLDKLAANWKPEITKEIWLKLTFGLEGLTQLNSANDMDWSLTGEASVVRYVAFGQGGAVDVAVSDLGRAVKLLGGRVENVPGYADVRLLETEEPGYYFDASVAEDGIKWASQLQAWVELRNGDARQQTAARDIRGQLIAGDNEWSR